MDKKRFEFASSILFFWIKNSVEVDERLIKVDSRGTILKVIPWGGNNSSLQLSNVSSVKIKKELDLKTMFIGFLITIFTFWTVIGLFIGIAVMGAGIITELQIRLNGGERYSISVPFYQKKIAIEANNYIQLALCDVAEQHDVRKTNREIDERVAARTEQQNAALLAALNKTSEE